MICQHIAVEDLLQLFALFAVSNIPLVRFQQFCGIFLTEIRCLQCLQITGIHLKHIFVSLFTGGNIIIANGDVRAKAVKLGYHYVEIETLAR